MQFSTSLLSYDDTIRNTILDYTVVLNPLGVGVLYSLKQHIFLCDALFVEWFVIFYIG